MKMLQRIKSHSDLKLSSGWTWPQFAGLLSPGRTLPGCEDQWWEEGFVPAFSEVAETPPAQTPAEARALDRSTMLLVGPLQQ